VKKGAVVLGNFSLHGAALQVKMWKREDRERQTFHYFNQLLRGLRFLHNSGHNFPFCALAHVPRLPFAPDLVNTLRSRLVITFCNEVIFDMATSLQAMLTVT
jgi:hypothetical protein